MIRKARANVTMAYLQALLLTIIVMWIPVRSSDATPELSVTRGDTVYIPCVFGDGTLRNIYWYYNDGTGPQLILKLFKGVLDIEEAYGDRADLRKDNFTLILKDVAVQDDGTYRCYVDRQGQTAVTNINTKLNVFSLAPSTLPVVPQCTVDDKSSCAVNASVSTILTCKLLNIYPVKDAQLNWYRDGQYIPSTNDSLGNEDGTFDMIRHIKVSKTENFTCNATFISANGTKNTAVPVSVCISQDVRNSPGTNLTGGALAGIVIGCILAVAVLVIVVFCTPKIMINSLGRNRRQKDNHDDVEEQGQLLTSIGGHAGAAGRLPQVIAETTREPGQKDISSFSIQESGGGAPTPVQSKSDNAHPLQGSNSASTLDNTPPPTPRPQTEQTCQGIDSSSPSTVQLEDNKRSSVADADFDDVLKTITESIPADKIDDLGKALGFKYPKIENFKATNSSGTNITSDGTLRMLREWRDKKTNPDEKAALRKCLQKARLNRLASLPILQSGQVRRYNPNDNDKDMKDESESTARSCQGDPASFLLLPPGSTGASTHDDTQPTRPPQTGEDEEGDNQARPNNNDNKQTEQGMLRTVEKKSGGTVSASAGPSVSRSLLRSSPQGVVSAYGDVSTAKTSTSDAVSDDTLNTLARHVPHGKYIDLSQKLDIDYNQADEILNKHVKDSAKAIRECLAIWKDKTGGSSAELKKIFDRVEIAGTMEQYIR